MRIGVLGFGLFLVLCFSSSPAVADSVLVQYTINGTFSADVNSAPLSGPDGTYQMSFALPQNPTPDFFDSDAGDFTLMNVPLAYSFQCQGCSTSASFTGNAFDVNFGGSDLGGMFVVEFMTGGQDYYFQFAGDTMFSGAVDAPTLLSGGPYGLTGAGIFELNNNPFVDLGSASVETTTIATPEPSTLNLLLGVLAIFGIIAILKPRSA